MLRGLILPVERVRRDVLPFAPLIFHLHFRQPCVILCATGHAVAVVHPGIDAHLIVLIKGSGTARGGDAQGHAHRPCSRGLLAVSGTGDKQGSKAREHREGHHPSPSPYFRSLFHHRQLFFIPSPSSATTASCPWKVSWR